MSICHRIFIFLFVLGLACPSFGAEEPEIIDNQPATLLYPPFWHTPLGIHRGTPALLKMFAGSRTRFASPQGLGCTRLLSTAAPPDPSQECQLTVVGANTGLGHVIYNPSLTSLEILGDSKNFSGIFLQPMGIAIARDGTTWVTDPGQHRVIRLRVQQQRLVPNGFLPDPPGGWKSPWGVACDSRGQIFVTDAERNQIFVFSPEGALQQTIGPRLSSQLLLASPKAIAIADASEPWSFYRDDFIFICDQDGQRLLRLNKAGNLDFGIDREILPGGDTLPVFGWLALDYYENLWVTDPEQCQIHKFSRDLQYLASYGHPGEGDGCFQSPTGIAIFRQFGQVFVAEKQGAQYFWIGADILGARAYRNDPRAGLVQLDFQLTEPAFVSISISNPAGQKEWLQQRRQYDSGLQHFYIPMNPQAVSSEFTFQIIAEATYSSARYFAKRVVVPLRK